MKFFITKYALTQGIIEMHGEIYSSCSTMVVEENMRNMYHKPFWHETKEEAVKHANELKNRKILSIEKQLAKIKKLNF